MWYPIQNTIEGMNHSRLLSSTVVASSPFSQPSLAAQFFPTAARLPSTTATVLSAFVSSSAPRSSRLRLLLPDMPPPPLDMFVQNLGLNTSPYIVLLIFSPILNSADAIPPPTTTWTLLPTYISQANPASM